MIYLVSSRFLACHARSPCLLFGRKILSAGRAFHGIFCFSTTCPPSHLCWEAVGEVCFIFLAHSQLTPLQFRTNTESTLAYPLDLVLTRQPKFAFVVPQTHPYIFRFPRRSSCLPRFQHCTFSVFLSSVLGVLSFCLFSRLFHFFCVTARTTVRLRFLSWHRAVWLIITYVFGRIVFVLLA